MPKPKYHNTSKSSILKILCVIVEDYIGKSTNYVVLLVLLLKLKSKWIFTLKRKNPIFIAQVIINRIDWIVITSVHEVKNEEQKWFQSVLCVNDVFYLNKINNNKIDMAQTNLLSCSNISNSFYAFIHRLFVGIRFKTIMI